MLLLSPIKLINSCVSMSFLGHIYGAYNVSKLFNSIYVTKRKKKGKESIQLIVCDLDNWMRYRKRSSDVFAHFQEISVWTFTLYTQNKTSQILSRVLRRFTILIARLLQHQVSILSQAIDVLVFRPAKSWQLNRDTKTFIRLNQSLALRS